MIRYRLHPICGHVGIRERRFGHRRRIVVDGLLKEVGTDDGHFANFSTVNQFRVADDVAPIARAVTAEIAQKQLVGSTSGAGCRTRWVIGDPLGQLEKLQTGQRRSAKFAPVPRVASRRIRARRMRGGKNFGAHFGRDPQRFENLIDIWWRIRHSASCWIEFTHGARAAHYARDVIILTQIRIPAIKVNADVSAHSAQSVPAVSAHRAAERPHIRVRLYVFLRGGGRRADDVATRALPSLRLNWSRPTCRWASCSRIF